MRCKTPLEVNGHLWVRLVLGREHITGEQTMVSGDLCSFLFGVPYLGGYFPGIPESRNTPYDLR